MTYVVTFDDVTPSPRADGIPWTKVRVQEGNNQAGPWTQIDEITLSPVDPDPANPMMRTITTEDATLEEGWYRLVFTDATGDLLQPTYPQQNVPDSESPFLPQVSDIGALLRARTKDTHGNELGTFASNTRPTYSEVVRIIDQAASDVFAMVDTDLPLATSEMAQDVIALGTCLLIELSYFPEQVAAQRSAYPEYKVMYDEKLARLLSAVEREAAEAISGELPMLGQVPAWSFPAAEPLWTKQM